MVSFLSLKPLRWSFVLSLWSVVFFSCALANSLEAQDRKRPNVLIIMADDCTYNDLPFYGGKNAKTPHLEALAKESLVFDRAYLSMAMCQPSRAELFTGQLAWRNGLGWNHAAVRPETRSVPHYLQPAGYRVGWAGKQHVQPAKSFPFEDIDGYDPNCVRNPTRPHDTHGITEFMSRSDDQPFFLYVGLVEPHVPWVMGDDSVYPPRKLQLPPNLADTPRTRQNFSKYLAEVTFMDQQVGEILDVLKQSGKAEETIVIFTSEQGAQFPGNKWTNWDTGLHTALLARWPGQIPAGKRTQALVQYADILPTLLELTGAQDQAGEAQFDGTSFASVLLGKTDVHREFVYGLHNNVPEGNPYPIRSISDGTHRYIRNLTPHELCTEKHFMNVDNSQTNYWGSWVAHSADHPEIYFLVKRYLLRPAEELYHSVSDAYEHQNLLLKATAERTPQTLEAHRRLSAELDRFLKEQKDPGIAMDTLEAHAAAKALQHQHPKP